MDLKKKIRSLASLGQRADAGFTLVELIVVIAILGILAGVGTVGYSGYIKKANMAADEQLISEVKHALTLGYYSRAIGASDRGSIILTTNGIKNASDLAGTGLETAMEATFGDSWSDLKLKCSDWNLSVAADANLMGYVHSSNQFGVDGIEPLLGTVEHITVQFSDWLKGGNLTPGTKLAPYLENAGINYKTDSQAAANATVMFVGSEISGCGLTEQEFADAWLNGRYDDITDDVVAQKAIEYAVILAQVKYAEEQAGITDGRYSNRLTSAQGEELVSIQGEVIGQMEQDIPNLEQYVENYALFADENLSSTCDAYQDAVAFYAYMSGMTSVSDSLLQSSDIHGSGFFSKEDGDSVVSKAVQDYVKLSEDLADVGVTNGVVISINEGVVTHMGATKD